jgi:c-di-AMP phosphodiesterase-like protein
MRKPLSILLTLIFLFNSGGYYLWYTVQQKKITEDVEQQIRKGLNREDLTLVVVSLSGENRVNWIKPFKEFRLNGEMYDVVCSKTEGQNKYYYCIIDSKEKQLIANFHQAHSSKKDADKRIKNSLSDRFIPRICRLTNNNFPIRIDYQLSPVAIVSTILKIPTPPPKTV